MTDAALPDRIGRYRVLQLLGQGAMGVVYRARDEGLERDVAVKVMRAETADAEARTRFLREARAAARLQHPNIVTVYDQGEHAGAPYIAMELLAGIDLQRAIEGGLRPDPRVTLPIVLQLLAGLGHAHENGIVHRDVKPSNLFLPRGRPVKIMDFGVARLGGGATSTGLIVGTPNYMSPEQVRAQPLDGRSDLFSAGLILYELVTGEKAYRADSVVSVLYKIAHEKPDLHLLPRGPQWETIRRVLARALAQDPAGRYADAQSMAADVGAALRELGGSADGATAADQGLMRRSTVRAAMPEERTQVPEAVVETAALQPHEVPVAVLPPAPARGRGLLALGILVVALLGLGAAALLYLLFVTHPTPAADVSSPLPGPAAKGPIPPSVSPMISPPPSPSLVTATRATTTNGTAMVRAPRPTASPSTTEGEAVHEAEATLSEVPAANARLERANELYERGRYNAALAEARAVLRREPANAEAKSLVEDIEADMVVEARLKQAKEAMKRGDREAALQQVKAGLAVKSTDGRLIALFRELTQ